MPIIVTLNTIMKKKGVLSGSLSKKIKITSANLSVLKNNKAKAIRFSTLEAVCQILHCQPGDIFKYVPSELNKKDCSNANK